MDEPPNKESEEFFGTLNGALDLGAGCLGGVFEFAIFVIVVVGGLCLLAGIGSVILHGLGFKP